jgi:dihydroxyacetone kinase-like protein
MDFFLNRDGAVIIDNVIQIICDNAAELSEIDGAIGDGDHGINMKKGALLARQAMTGKTMDLTTALKTLGQVLLMEIGGSMGPLYGTFFRKMAKATKDKAQIDAPVFGSMLQASFEGVQSLGNAKVGDKTMLDTLAPAIKAYQAAKIQGKTFKEALVELKMGAEQGQASTKNLVAKAGRASRLGERTKGHLDAGATSCCLILCSMADSMIALMEEGDVI